LKGELHSKHRFKGPGLNDFVNYANAKLEEVKDTDILKLAGDGISI
jgi:hypothetical protein